MPGALSRTLIVLNSSKKETKQKIFETRKKELKGIFKTFQDISKQEKERTQILWDSHKKFFEEPQPAQEPEIVVIQEEDDFFKK